MDTNFGHVQNGRAELCGFLGFACAKGSHDNLGLFNIFVTTTLIETEPGFFRKGACAVSPESRVTRLSGRLGANVSRAKATAARSIIASKAALGRAAKRAAAKVASQAP